MFFSSKRVWSWPLIQNVIRLFVIVWRLLQSHNLSFLHLETSILSFLSLLPYLSRLFRPLVDRLSRHRRLRYRSQLSLVLSQP